MTLRTLAKNHQLDCFNKDDSHWKEPFFFVQGADLQMGMIDSYFLKKENPGWDQEIELGNKAVAMVNQMKPKPKFFVICGDLCDAMPGWSTE
ncbi:Serine/threonine-protein phosphatase CPPED1 [Blattella germanica]|nr:Serine/threonine-protein phosphatase CPPED1 [Blattella germanica]